MRFFFDHEAGAGGTSFNTTASYVELVTASADPPGTSYLYVLPGPIPNSVTVTACWGHDLDAWLPLLTDPERSADWIKALGSTFPTIGRLWDAAAGNELGRTALLRDLDSDDMSLKWFVKRSLGNVLVPEDATVDSIRTFLSSPRLTDVYRAVLGDSFAAAGEIATRRPSATVMAAMYGKELIRGQLKAMDTFNEWAPRLSRIFSGI